MARPAARWRARGVPAAILEYDRRQALRLAEYPSLEAQAAGIADDIAYNAHDIDDGLRAGLFELGELRSVPYLATLIAEVEHGRPGLEDSRKIHELSRRVITRFVEDAIVATGDRLRVERIETVADVRRANRPMFAFSAPMAAAEREIKSFLFVRMYRHPEVNGMRERADRIVRGLFSAYARSPSEMPPFWAARAAAIGAERASADYVAGMTDRFALGEYRRLFDPERAVAIKGARNASADNELMNIFADFEARVAALLTERIAAGALPEKLDLGRFVVEPPRDAAHGDLAANAAMIYAREAKAAGSNPRALAEALADGLRRGEDVAGVEVAGPGFLNIKLKPHVFEEVLRTALRPGRCLWARRAQQRRRR